MLPSSKDSIQKLVPQRAPVIGTSFCILAIIWFVFHILNTVTIKEIESEFKVSRHWYEVEVFLDQNSVSHGYVVKGSHGSFQEPNFEEEEIGYHFVLISKVRHLLLFTKTMRYFLVVDEEGTITRIKSENVSPMP